MEGHRKLVLGLFKEYLKLCRKLPNAAFKRKVSFNISELFHFNKRITSAQKQKAVYEKGLYDYETFKQFVEADPQVQKLFFDRITRNKHWIDLGNDFYAFNFSNTQRVSGRRNFDSQNYEIWLAKILRRVLDKISSY